MSRLPIHVRLVAGFAAAMFVLLTATGAFVYWRVDYALDRGLATELSQAAATIAPLANAAGDVTDPAQATATGADWQVVAAGSVTAYGGAATSTPLVSPTRLPASGTATFDVGSILSLTHARPVRVRADVIAPDVWVLVAVRRDHRDEALRELLGQLALAGFGSLAIATLIGGLLARSALRPVERYRARASEIAAGGSGLRLDVPVERDDEVTRLGHTLNDMLTAHEQALERQRRFVQDASHELRTPLTLLKARIQMTRSRPRTPQAYEHALDELAVDIERLARLSEDLLEQAAPDPNSDPTTEPTAGPVDVAAIVRALGSERSGVRVDAPTPALTTALDDHGVRRVVTNLLDNAALHGAEPITCQVQTLFDHVILAVEDSGPGLPPDQLAAVTGRFTRAPEARSRPGSGLGLALVEQVVTGAGGELRVCSGGNHTSYGTPVDVPCDHGPAMQVSVLLPVRSSAG